MKKNKKYPKYAGGGKFWQGLGNVAANTGLAIADTGLSALGATDVIKSDMYKGTTAKGFDTAGNILGGVAKAGAPMAANALLPGSGMALSAVQSGVGAGLADPNQVPQQPYSQGYAPQQPNAGFNPMSMMGPMMQMGMQMAPYGGQIGTPNAELEKQENTLNPDGSTNQYNGPSHAQGGIPTKLDPSTLVFSDRLKLGKKTFADLNKPNMTNKEDKIIDDPKANKRAKLTAELMKTAKNAQSVKLFQEQEALKAKKMGSYAKRIGMEGFAYGGQVPKYWAGGPYDPAVENPNDVSGYSGEYHNPNIGQPVIGGTPNYGVMQSPFRTEADFAKGLASHNALKNTPSAPSANQLMAPSVLPVQPTGMQVDPSASPTDYDRYSAPQGQGGPNWSNIAGQVGLGLAANAGNLYDLYRSRKADTESYGRVAPSLLDPTQAIKENDQTFRGAVDSAREASVGNSSTFLNNRRSLAAEKMRANARIRETFANQNAGIQNQMGMYNNNVGTQETIANAQNQAQARNIRSNALSNIGHNVYQQGATNIRNQNMSDQELQYLKYLAQLYPQGVK